jgi:superfamily II DNA/RNA helicase
MVSIFIDVRKQCAFHDFTNQTFFFYKMNRQNLELNLKLRDPSAQLLLVSATIPRDMKKILEELINCDTDLNKLATTKINKLMLHVPQKFIRTNADKRLKLLLEILNKEVGKEDSKPRAIMIFSHRTKTVEFISKYLEENGVECDMLINRLNNEQREKVVSRFFNGEVRVLCCTDIASRGWNTLHVSHVINFEMPPFVADYLHRCGRVGRLNSGKRGSGGGQGLVTNFVTKSFEVELVMNIERSLRTGSELVNVNANAKRIYTHLHESREARNRYSGTPSRSQKSDKSNNNKEQLESEEEADDGSDFDEQIEHVSNK